MTFTLGRPDDRIWQSAGMGMEEATTGTATPSTLTQNRTHETLWAVVWGRSLPRPDRPTTDDHAARGAAHDGRGRPRRAALERFQPEDATSSPSISALSSSTSQTAAASRSLLTPEASASQAIAIRPLRGRRAMSLVRLSGGDPLVSQETRVDRIRDLPRLYQCRWPPRPAFQA